MAIPVNKVQEVDKPVEGLSEETIFDLLPSDILLNIVLRVRNASSGHFNVLGRTNRAFLALVRQTSCCLRLRDRKPIRWTCKADHAAICADWVCREMQLRPGVRQLVLVYTPVTKKYLKSLILNPSFQVIRERGWSGVIYSFNTKLNPMKKAPDLADLERMPSLLGDASNETLTSLVLNSWPCPAPWIGTLSRFSHLQKLVIQGLCHKGQNPKYKECPNQQTCFSSPCFPSLTHLDIRDLRHSLYADFPNLLPRETVFPKLRNLYSTKIDFEELLQNIPETPRSMKVLHTNTTGANDALLEELALRCTSLKDLTLWGEHFEPKITRVGLDSLLAKCPFLHTLCLPRTDRVTASEWCELLSNRDFKSLVLATLSNKLVDLLKKMKSLEVLYLDNVDNLVMVQELAKGLAKKRPFVRLSLRFYKGGRGFWVARSFGILKDILEDKYVDQNMIS
jgi:hypothetical protein